VAAVAQAGAHVPAHLAEADESDLHAWVSSRGFDQDSRRRGINR
jgi:hypothetical protein